MAWFALLGWLLKCVFSCNHLRTPVNEGKCYCPDCGRGLIYRWVVLRCAECRTRRDSRYFLRQVVPAQSCCAYCGADAVREEALESPMYFQLHKAQLIVQEEHDFLQGRRLAWTAYVMGDALGRRVEETISRTRDAFRQPPAQPMAFLPARISP